jgi:hypothetical protein
MVSLRYVIAYWQGPLSFLLLTVVLATRACIAIVQNSSTVVAAKPLAVILAAI